MRRVGGHPGGRPLQLQQHPRVQSICQAILSSPDPMKKKQLVFEMRRESADRQGPHRFSRILAAARRSLIVSFIDNEKIIGTGVGSAAGSGFPERTERPDRGLNEGQLDVATSSGPHGKGERWHHEDSLRCDRPNRLLLIVFFLIASLLWTGALPYACRERKLVLILVGMRCHAVNFVTRPNVTLRTIRTS